MENCSNYFYFSRIRGNEFIIASVSIKSFTTLAVKYLLPNENITMLELAL